MPLIKDRRRPESDQAAARRTDQKFRQLPAPGYVDVIRLQDVLLAEQAGAPQLRPGTAHF